MPILPWRAKQSTSTTGTGTLTLDAAPAAARSFNAAFGSSSIVVRYVISWASGYEIGIGTFDGGSPGTLTRSIVLASSNSGALVSLPAGVKDVFAWIDPGERRLIESTATTVNITPEHLGNYLYWTGTSAGTVNLAAIANVPLGSDIEIRNDGTALITVDANGSETINGFTTLTLAPNEAATLRRVTAGWVSSALPAEAFIRRQAASGVAAVDFTLPAGFRAFRITISDMVVATAGNSINLRTSVDGGSSFAAAASDYNFRVIFNSTSSALTTSTSDADLLALSRPMDSTSVLTGNYLFFVGSGVLAASLIGDATYVDNGGGTAYGGVGVFAGRRNAAGVVNAIRILPSSGNLSGVVSLAGIR